ncbi:alpha-1,6-mannosylglycoprotein 6-beta-N-acetylglucosaminyltransferase A-like [Mya arenaria]|uniref:alpha-1,6-mannosylglycoprotein 6-beta-N-acetylglucosaminyltransferase A-like n=1 Tax=Mya arenaria TaxID=6604 RepID=UPI0022E118E1|nr:alpha-1,6-mannosylglycoprotein 6-beta-N-acetylglucosaminyltransferase A-like [Mya arenaria]XP_052815042.1 alpha-1,6-mannosylglycoprotein 6-beta-N-acetylglucosaminyltransferase A-like [Mya arenaria]
MACRLVCLKVYKGQWCILLAVSTLLWMLTLFNINSSNVVGSDRIKDEVIQLSERYIRTLARDSEGVVDGPYAGRFTAYDLKKTMAVLLENMIERLDRIEHRLNISSNLTKPSLSGDISMTHSLYAKDLINGEHELCALTDKERQLYPKCEQKIEWMKNMWQSDPCYASFGVDGSTCSFIMFLSEVEGWCPRSAWHGSNKAPVEKNSSDNLAKINHDLEGLMKLLVDPNERQGYAWMRMRIKRIWPRWETAVKSLAAKQDLTKRKQKKILVHLGLLSKQSGWKFAEMQFKGGPLGELVQWSDLITALYVLGHELTITSEVEQLANIVSQLPAANSPCQSRKELPVDIIYIDIVGLKQFKKYVKNGYGKFSCLVRVVDSFGTEPGFNLRTFAKQRKKLSSWGGQDLNPQQFFTMFPHSPDNSFMGFVVERHLNESNARAIQRSNMALVYGKNDYMWAGKEEYLNTVNKSEIVIHGTVYSDSDSKSPLKIPSYVINHGILNGEDLHKLLRQSKIFLGLGFPYEGPAPLEAIANGAVFINPKFLLPHSRNTQPFFKGKPTERELMSQHPYAEQFIGEPHVYTINIEDPDEVRTTVQKILDMEQFNGFLPYEFTEEGFIQRMNAYIEHQNFCQFQRQLNKWPPESAVKVLFGDGGKSCKDVCWEKNLICEPSHFLAANSHSILMSRGAACAANKTLTDIYYPALDTKTNDCIIQQEELLFSCVGKQDNLRRLCPCRNYFKGQSALCVGCEL